MNSLDWAISQTNRPLQCELDVDRAYLELAQRGLPFHNERWKNWDAWIATAHVTANTPTEDRVLDAGACRDPKYPSPFLPAIQKQGYQRLTGVNLDEKETEYENGICYHHGDITNLPFSGRHFGFVACLSVLEHGVDWRLFFVEMQRVIRGGGRLFISFDYWDDPIDVGDRMAFGAPVHIFDRAEVMQMVAYARDTGFNLNGPLDLTCKDRVVTWLGLQYTFCNLLFYRR